MRRGRSVRRRRSDVARIRLSGVVVLAGLLGALPGPAAAERGRVACSTRGGSGPNLGPCQSPDAVDYFATGSDGRGIAVTNFGILMPGDRLSSWQVVCDDNYGLAAPTQVRLHPDGRVFAASNEGLYFSADGCTWSQAMGDIAGRITFDVAFDRLAPSQVFALGEIPRQLWRSADGGQSFTHLRTFDSTLTFHRLMVAPSDGKRIYLVGRGRQAATPIARSLDGGLSFEIGDISAGSIPPPMNPLEPVAVAPDDPSILYFSVINVTDGDEVWRSSDGGKTAVMILRMPDDAFSGLTFGATAQTIYVAGLDPFPLIDKPPARLYVSRDGGQTWADPIVSAQTGPRYRCLTWSAGKLYACGTGEPGGDAFLIGVSSDDGKTWAPAVRLDQLAGAKSCVQARCLQTEEWLCVNYCTCAPGMQPVGGGCANAPVDGGARDGPRAGASGGGDAGQGSATEPGASGREKQGCSCSLGATRAGSSPPAWSVVLVVLGWSLTRRVRRPSRR